MSHDTDKLIRQLSLVAFLMAERRPLTARDVKGNVEGYSEMSDEAFARRFYSDRAELIARRPAPLAARRVHGRSCTRSAPRTTSSTSSSSTTTSWRRFRRLSTCSRARSRTRSRSGLAPRTSLGRPGFDDAPTETASRACRCAIRTTRPRWPVGSRARVRDLEAAHDQVQLLVAAARPERANGRSIPTRSGATAAWYTSSMISTLATCAFRVSRIRSDIRFATRRERDFPLPADFDVDAYRVGEDWQHGPVAGTARIEVNGDTAWWVHRTLRGQARSSTASSRPSTRRSSRSRAGCWPERPRRAARAGGARTAYAEGSAGARGARGRAAEARAREGAEVAGRRRASRPRVRAGALRVLQASSPTCSRPAATDAVLDADDLAPASTFPARSFRSIFRCSNLVNFGGGCYTSTPSWKATSFASTGRSAATSSGWLRA